MSIKEICFQSANERDIVKGWVYTPLQKPRAIIQVVHGFGEHSRRYIRMINKFQDAGYVVYADDHIGHGKTAADSNTWGYPGDKGYTAYIKDEYALHNMAVSDYPDIPYFMYGHSWGSMIARAYAAAYGKDLAGVILCGVVAGLKGFDKWAGNEEFKHVIESGHGKDNGDEWMAKIFGDMTSRYENVNGPTDWIAKDASVVADHAADPFNNMSPSNQLLYDLLELHDYIRSDTWAEKMRRDLPIYMISGDQDPCGNYGEGVYHAANQLIEKGNKNITVHCYTGYRHEVHNEPEIRDIVADGIINFINANIV